jgi:hypothetical protein
VCSAKTKFSRLGRVGDKEVVELLLAKGADVNAPGGYYGKLLLKEGAMS